MRIDPSLQVVEKARAIVLRRRHVNPPCEGGGSGVVRRQSQATHYVDGVAQLGAVGGREKRRGKL